MSDVLESNWETVKEGVLEDSRNLTGVLPILNISLDTPVKDKQFVKVTVKSFYGYSSGLEYFDIVRTDTRPAEIFSQLFYNFYVNLSKCPHYMCENMLPADL